MGIKPKLRPKDDEFKKIVAAANSGGGGGDKPAAGGGKGGGKSVNPMAKKGSADYKKMQKANAPDSFYGYYDQNTGDYVPWYIDMINGGGANAAGPTFEGGPLYGRMAGGLLNAAGVSPYGQDRPRPFMPMEAYRGGDTAPAPFDYRSGASAAPAPTGVIDAAVEPLSSGPTTRGGRRGSRPVAPKTSDQAIGGYQYPSMYRQMDRQVGLFQQGQSSPTPAVPQGGALQPMPAKSLMDRYLPASMDMGQVSAGALPNMPAPSAFSASGPSVAAMTPPSAPNQAVTAFNQAMATVPQMLQGTQIAEMYRDHLLNGGGGTFAQFTGAQ